MTNTICEYKGCGRSATVVRKTVVDINNGKHYYCDKHDPLDDGYMRELWEAADHD